jgi:predicted dehydrogenase
MITYIGVGYGNVAKLHDDKLKLAEANLLGIIDTNQEKREKAAKSGIRVFQSIEEAAHLSPDFWDIRTPNNTHLACLEEIARLEKGHILLEKPVCTPEQIDVMKASAAGLESKGRIIIVNENYSHSTTVQTVAETIRRENLHPHLVVVEMSKNRRKDTQDGRQVDIDLGVLAHEGPHMLKSANLLGEGFLPESILFASFNPMIADNGRILLKQGSFLGEYKTSNGCTVSFATSMDGGILHPIDLAGFRDEKDLTGRINTRYRILDVQAPEGRILARWEPVPNFTREGKLQTFDRGMGFVLYTDRTGKETYQIVKDDNIGASLTYAVEVFSGRKQNISPISQEVETVRFLNQLRARAENN